MQTTTANADGRKPEIQNAASDALNVQDGVNLIAILNSWQRNLKALRDLGLGGDELNNHPISLAYTSKLVALTRLSTGREIEAFEAVERLKRGESANYDVIPIK